LSRKIKAHGVHRKRRGFSIVGWLAAIGMWLIEGSYVPQIVRLYRVKEFYEISLFFPLINLAGRLLVMLYSAAVGERVLALGFLAGITLRTVLLSQTLYYRWRCRRIEYLRNNTLGL